MPDRDASMCRRRAAPHRANALRGVNEVVLEGPDRRRGPAADAGLLVDVLDVVPDGLGGDAQLVADRVVRVPERERQEHLALAFGQPGRQLAWPLGDAVSR